MLDDKIVFTATREKETKNMVRFEEEGPEAEHVMGKPYFSKARIPTEAKKVKVTIEVVE